MTPTLPVMHALHVVVLQPLALAFSALGAEPCYLLLLPLVYWLVDRRIGARLGILLIGSMLLNDLAKTAFHLPRPFWVDSSLTPLSHLGVEHSFGFPSGHSQGAFLVWPFLAMQTRDKKKWLPLALILASCIALSRMVLGVHWPLDVLGGALMGGGLCALYLRFGGGWERAFRRASRRNQTVVIIVFIALCGALAALFVTGAVRATGTTLAQFGQSAWSLEKSAIERCAAMLGLLVGLVFAPSDVQASGAGTAWQKALRLLVGFAGLIVFYFGFKVVAGFAAGTFARYFLTTFWVTCLSLWVFRRLEVSEQQKVVNR